ncbi:MULTISPECIES: EpsG family protein [unclassified Flavobacterium]|uniref:EpsG family protein n=1 Tax=unclassified Flavobacterium TaxID=196869 RepID=UPI001291ACAA|nr:MULTISPECIES: EpsG family protein [unclassified Flavobacterium]MQP52064.1 hypothetical protein [Flavobacterium sp. LMO9]MQP61933.1 hypothetical protein [Flavobacterium sp. LMO6]
MDNTQKGYLILLMFISPLLGLITFLKSKNEKILLFFGVFFFGVAGSLYIYAPGSDGEEHLRGAIHNYMDMSFRVFIGQFYDLLTLNSTSGAKDIYLHCISFVSASLFGIPELIHVFAGLILGYFFSKSVLLILKDNLTIKKSSVLIGLIIILLMFRSLGAMNSIRMWTGMWVFFYGTFSYATSKEKKYLFVVLFSIVVHFSYVIVLLPFLTAYFFRKRTYALTLFYLLSFGLTLNFASISNLIPKTSMLESQQSANVITSDDDAKRFAERGERSSKVNQNFYVKYGEGFFKSFVIVGLSFILLFFFISKNADDRFNFLMASGMGLYSFSNLVTFSPALSGRISTIGALFILAAAIHFLLTIKNYNLTQRKIKLLNKGLIIFIVFSIPMVLFQISYLIQMLSFFSLVLAPISWFIGDTDFSIRDGLGYFF